MYKILRHPNILPMVDPIILMSDIGDLSTVFPLVAVDLSFGYYWDFSSLSILFRVIIGKNPEFFNFSRKNHEFSIIKKKFQGLFNFSQKKKLSFWLYQIKLLNYEIESN